MMDNILLCLLGYACYWLVEVRGRSAETRRESVSAEPAERQERPQPLVPGQVLAGRFGPGLGDLEIALQSQHLAFGAAQQQNLQAQVGFRKAAQAEFAASGEHVADQLANAVWNQPLRPSFLGGLAGGTLGQCLSIGGLGSLGHPLDSATQMRLLSGYSGPQPKP